MIEGGSADGVEIGICLSQNNCKFNSAKERQINTPIKGIHIGGNDSVPSELKDLLFPGQ